MTTNEATSKHTAGEWQVDEGAALSTGDHAVNADVTPGGPWKAVATVHHGRMGGGSAFVQPGEADANARLIASAPTMLAALTAAESVMRSHIMPEHFDGHAAKALEQVRAAIAKATGK